MFLIRAVVGTLSVLLVAVNVSCGEGSDEEAVAVRQFEEIWEEEPFGRARVCVARRHLPADWADLVVELGLTDEAAEEIGKIVDEKCPAESIDDLDDQDKTRFLWDVFPTSQLRLVCEGLRTDPDMVRQAAAEDEILEYLEIDPDFAMGVWAENCGSEDPAPVGLAEQWNDLPLHGQALVCAYRELSDPDDPDWAMFVASWFVADEDPDLISEFVDEQCPVGPLDETDKKAAIWDEMDAEDKRMVCEDLHRDPESVLEWLQESPFHAYLGVDPDFAMDVYTDGCD